MSKTRLTVTVDPDVAEYLDTVDNKSLVVSEAVRSYCAGALQRELEQAYRADREEAARIAAEWAPADADLDE
ncbi:MAG: hypothetical protein PVJ51_00970 [Acidobacteriota bacterium]|jgi:hypothetical protein